MDRREYLLLATSQGLAICERSANSWQVSRRELNDSYITCVIAHGGVILAGTKDGIYRSADAGETWQAVNEGLVSRHIRWMARAEGEQQRFFAGSEPAGIFLSVDGGLSWEMRPEVKDLREQNRWYLPYSPEAGCVRGFAFNQAKGYAAVEVGGVLYSHDSGENWRLDLPGSNAAPAIHPDVHSIEVHPSSPDLVAAPTGGGFYLTRDGGLNWEARYPGCYCRAVWWHPMDADWMVLGPADGVDRNGRIEQSRDGGLTWQAASGGLEVPWSNHMVERFFQAGEQLLAVLSNGELLAASFETYSWQRLLSEVEKIHAAELLEVKGGGGA